LITKYQYISIYLYDDYHFQKMVRRLFIKDPFHWTVLDFYDLITVVFYVKLCIIIDSFIRWMSHLYVGLMKNHPYGHSMKRHFDEKALWWKAASPRKLLGFVRYCRYHQVLNKAWKNILIHFLVVISQYFTLLILNCLYWVSSHIISESII
jgi:hypothetical protein